MFVIKRARNPYKRIFGEKHNTVPSCKDVNVLSQLYRMGDRPVAGRDLEAIFHLYCTNSERGSALAAILRYRNQLNAFYLPTNKLTVNCLTCKFKKYVTIKMTICIYRII